MSQVIEMVSFNLLSTANEKEFIQAAEKSHAFVSTLPGFLYRSLSHNEESGNWTDTVYWQSMEEAKSAGEQFMSCPDCQPLMSLINPESVDMKHQVVKMSSCEG